MKFKFPHTYPLKNGQTVTIDLLKSSDYKDVHNFFGRLTDNDREYLKYDVSNLEFVRDRMAGIDQKTRISISARNADGLIVGESTVYWTQFGWKSHIGKLRIVVDKDYRGFGLSRYLAQLIFFKAQQLGLSKIIAEFVPLQAAAGHILGELGLKKVAVLPGFAIDKKNNKHDIVVMAADLENLLEKYENMIMDDEHKGG
ncbi:MAG: hypothetical protein CO090_02050 [Acidobacteria bacterium CG_4_9_14_3_um_filter_49_7]|nr:MAG: hypothetical protein CO090_02050 [Acidobacteria bacterium CG_4_9_14_3_um_filter_49_7]